MMPRTQAEMPPEFPPPYAAGWGEYRHYGLFSDLEYKGVTQRLWWIVPGEFLMGSPESEKGRYNNEGPQHPVKITRGFWLAETPCTQALWKAVMGTNPSYFPEDGADRPVEHVSWDDCQEFLAKLNGLAPGLALRLPTEAEWEYACRAGSQTRWFFGDDEAKLKEYAWYDDNSGGKTQPVRGKQPNGNGLRDMHGNVWEWCSDYWKDDYVGAASVDPSGPEKGDGRVLRGGSWGGDARLCRSAYRFGGGLDNRFNDVGFRFAQVPARGSAGGGQQG